MVEAISNVLNKQVSKTTYIAISMMAMGLFVTLSPSLLPRKVATSRQTREKLEQSQAEIHVLQEKLAEIVETQELLRETQRDVQMMQIEILEAAKDDMDWEGGLTTEEFIDILADNFDEVRAIWEELPDDRPLRDAAIIWQKRQEKIKQATTASSPE